MACECGCVRDVEGVTHEDRWPAIADLCQHASACPRVGITDEIKVELSAIFVAARLENGCEGDEKIVTFFPAGCARTRKRRCHSAAAFLAVGVTVFGRKLEVERFFCLCPVVDFDTDRCIAISGEFSKQTGDLDPGVGFVVVYLTHKLLLSVGRQGGC